MSKAAEKKHAPAKRGPSQLDIIDVGATLPGEALAVQEDADFVTTAGRAVQTFLASALVFFKRAGEIELAAVATLAVAERLKPPTTELEDRTIQNFILKTNADKKTAEEHWKITTVISGFHRRMTGARARATDPLSRANVLANNLHNRYVDQERARVERENREREEAALREQQRLRDEELAALERKAVEAEERAPELSKREQVFVERMVAGGFTARQCAQMAGFKNPLEDSARLTSLAKIQAAIRAGKEAMALREQKVAVKAAPLDPVSIDEVRPAISKPAGAKSRTTWSAEVFNERALIDAILENKLGIPTALLRIDQTVANEYAASLQERLDRWPGIRAKSKTVTF